MKNYQNAFTERLYKAVSLLNTPEECAAFFEDVCTIREIQDMSTRFEIATMLMDGNGYQKIVDATGASPATIARVNRTVVCGSDGYQIALQHLTETENEDDRT